MRLCMVSFISFIIFVLFYMYNNIVLNSYEWSSDLQTRMALIQTLGLPPVPIISQCCSSRDIVEGIYARRSDIPGGYCYHSDCDVAVTGKSNFISSYSMRVISP